jgi:hypothetical protein
MHDIYIHTEFGLQFTRKRDNVRRLNGVSQTRVKLNLMQMPPSMLIAMQVLLRQLSGISKVVS